jgi:FHA domain
MTARCPAGHDSTELDYCSVCGAVMATGAVVARGPGPIATGGATVCPACGEPRADPDTRYCEVCRYDFVSQKGGPAPQARAPVPAKLVPSPAPPLVAAPAAAGYVLVVQVDASLDIDPDPATPPPQGVADIRLPMTQAELLVGRKDDLRDVHPDIPLADPGSSRRHAKFVKSVDGSLALHDLASTNGTKLNGVEVPAGSRSPLHAGDEVTIGRWTRIKVEAQP